MISKTKLAKERFRMKALFNKVLDFLLEGKNVRISFLYEAHEGEFIMHGQKTAQRYVENCCSSTF